ncbi:hypothetical protein MD484_g2862, partial [Candolleomyces efflorescens]
MARNFEGAHDFHIDNFQVFNVHPAASPLEKLESHIAAGAIHDSAERCDAPKCQAATRVAVQNDLYNWAVDGDGGSEAPKRIKWVTGPAGCGKTAIMGSLAVRCAAKGVLGASFFFASWSISAGRRRKTSLVTTIAHQLVRYHPDLREEISKAIDTHSDIFDKHLQIQMEVLVLIPLRDIASRPNPPALRGAILVDGVDECEAEPLSRVSTPGIAERTKLDDQREILQVLQSASAEPSFPFRIIIASRPERVFREFFDSENDSGSTFAKKLDLHQDYNADADITLFLEAQFNILRRRYHFPPSWPRPGTIEALVKNASGQFIYAATVIRLLDSGRQESPEDLLEAILKTGETLLEGGTSTPLDQLDALYAHILNSSPNPLLSVRWIHGISQLNEGSTMPGTVHVEEPYASLIHMVLQTDPQSNEAEHLLGNLHSLIRIPPPSKRATAKYDFYHKTLFDFLQDPSRCKELYIQKTDVIGFLWDRISQACARGCNAEADYKYPEEFLKFLTDFPATVVRGCAHQTVIPTSTATDWWVSLAIAHDNITSIEVLFFRIHDSCACYLDCTEALVAAS